LAGFLPIRDFGTDETRIRSLSGRSDMSTQNLSEDVLLVNLPAEEPQIANELKHINELVTGRDCCNVVIDFSGVEIITSSSISNLIILHKFLNERGRKLFLCNVAFVTKCIFTVAGLDKIFDFVEDPSAALTSMQR
jgi:anti-anti-sigma factor